tara:strand:+ start:5941 stop:6351 length:411 start_codon:yes stop_codon:yes gene_type:complete
MKYSITRNGESLGTSSTWEEAIVKSTRWIIANVEVSKYVSASKDTIEEFGEIVYRDLTLGCVHVFTIERTPNEREALIEDIRRNRHQAQHGPFYEQSGVTRESCLEYAIECEKRLAKLNNPAIRQGDEPEQNTPTL